MTSRPDHSSDSDNDVTPVKRRRFRLRPRLEDIDLNSPEGCDIYGTSALLQDQQRAASVLSGIVSGQETSEPTTSPAKSKGRQKAVTPSKKAVDSSPRRSTPTRRSKRMSGLSSDVSIVEDQSTSFNSPGVQNRSLDASLRAPTPPSADGSPVTQRRRRVSAQTRKALRQLAEVAARLPGRQPPAPRTPPRRGRGQHPPAQDGILISDEEDPNDVIVVESPRSEGRKIIVKVRTRLGAVQRFSMRRNDTFDRVFASLAESEGVSVDRVQIFAGDCGVMEYDSPARLNITIADVLVCAISSEGESAKSRDDEDPDNPDVITLQVQRQGQRSKDTVTIKPDDPLERLIRIYCTRHKLPAGSLVCMWDGENVRSHQSPKELDMEDGDCIDLLAAS